MVAHSPLFGLERSTRRPIRFCSISKDQVEKSSGINGQTTNGAIQGVLTENWNPGMPQSLRSQLAGAVSKFRDLLSARCMLRAEAPKTRKSAVVHDLLGRYACFSDGSHDSKPLGKCAVKPVARCEDFLFGLTCSKSSAFPALIIHQGSC